MPGGEVQLVAYGEENMYLSDKPQITFFKIVYRRYTNFSTETVQTNFIYQATFGKKISCELSKIGDLIHKMWLVLELPSIPILYDLSNTVDNKLSPTACQNVMIGKPNIVGINQFHNNISGQPNNKTTNAINPIPAKIPTNTFSIFFYFCF